MWATVDAKLRSGFVWKYREQLKYMGVSPSDFGGTLFSEKSIDRGKWFTLNSWVQAPRHLVKWKPGKTCERWAMGELARPGDRIDGSKWSKFGWDQKVWTCSIFALICERVDQLFCQIYGWYYIHVVKSQNLLLPYFGEWTCIISYFRVPRVPAMSWKFKKKT